MHRRCPESKKIGKARLPGYRWIVTSRGYANIVRAEKEEVEGILYAISAADEAALDGYEGVATGCYCKATKTVYLEESTMEALVYIDPIEEEGKPKDEYVGRMTVALIEADLSPRYVARYMKRFIENK